MSWPPFVLLMCSPIIGSIISFLVLHARALALVRISTLGLLFCQAILNEPVPPPLPLSQQRPVSRSFCSRHKITVSINSSSIGCSCFLDRLNGVIVLHRLTAALRQTKQGIRQLRLSLPSLNLDGLVTKLANSSRNNNNAGQSL